MKVPEPGTLFADRYRVDSILGEGGMGVVVGARDEMTGVACAIKILSAPRASDRERMIREARALMLVTSPWVVRIFDIREHDGDPYLVLERLEGRSFAELSPLGVALPVELVAKLAEQVCHGLAAAHAAGIIHRDIKLSNLFLLDGPGERVKLLDFGISKLDQTANWDANTLTADHGLLGSPQFVSPEQIASPRTVDARTDLWALGVVMVRLVTGQFPFQGASALDTLRAIGNAKKPPPLPREVPSAFRRIVDRCLAYDVNARYPNAETVAADLQSFLDEPATAALQTRPPSSTRSRGPIALLASMAAVVLGFFAVRGSSRSGETPPAASAPVIVVATPGAVSLDANDLAAAPVPSASTSIPTSESRPSHPRPTPSPRHARSATTITTSALPSVSPSPPSAASSGLRQNPYLK